MLLFLTTEQKEEDDIFLALKQWQDCYKMTYQVPLELQYLSFGNEKNTLKQAQTKHST